MNPGGLTHMSYNNFSTGGFNPSNGFSSRPRNTNPHKRLSVALPSHVGAFSDVCGDQPSPRTTSRSHLLAGLRTAPKAANPPASAPYFQTQHNLGNAQGQQWARGAYTGGNGAPQPASANAFSMNQQYAMQAAQQTYALPEQVLAPPESFEHAEEMDPNVLEELQLTGLYLAQRSQQLQQLQHRIASVNTAAGHYQGLDMAAYQQHGSMASVAQPAQEPVPVPGQHNLYIIQNPLTGQYQYVQLNVPQQQPQLSNQLGRSQTMHSLGATQFADPYRPVFRAEISPPTERPTLAGTRTITPPTKSNQPKMEHVEPLPPPSANAFRRGHAKRPSSISINNNDVAQGPKTASAAVFGSSRPFMPPTPMTGTFGPGAARAGEHPVRQPRGPPPIDELIALPTANHEGSKNFAARRRRMALNNLVRAGSVRRGVSNPSTVSPTSDGGMSLTTSEEEEPGFYRKQSPIGSERSTKRGSQSSIDGSTSGSAAQTPATEECDAFDMSSFIKQLPAHVRQGNERRKMMLGVLSAAEKRKSSMF